MCGTIGIGWTAEEQPGDDTVSLTRIALGAFLIACVLTYQSAFWPAEREQDPARDSGKARRASARLLGLGGRSSRRIVGVGGGTPHHLREQFLKGQVVHDSIIATAPFLKDVGTRKETRVLEINAGFRSGTFFSLSASACKVGFLLSRRGHHPSLCALAGLGASVALTGAGLVCQRKG